MIDQGYRNNQCAGDGRDGRGQADDTLGHDVIFAGLVVIGVTASLLGLLAIIVIVVVQIIGIVHLGAVVLVILVVEQTALGGITADALGFLVLIIRITVALRLKGGGSTTFPARSLS